MQRYEYKTINSSHYKSVEDAANSWAEDGWRTVSVVPARAPGYADVVVLEREIASSEIFLQGPPRHVRQWWNPRTWQSG